jgi:hypothetical protein
VQKCFQDSFVAGSERSEITHTAPMLNAEFYLAHASDASQRAGAGLESDFWFLRLLHALRAVPVSFHLPNVDNLTCVISVMRTDLGDR